jgi:hypothetical protein
MNTNDNKTNLPLQWYWKMMAFMLPLIPLVFGPYAFMEKEYRRRYMETWLWTYIGLLFWTLIAIVLIGIKSLLN